MVGLRGVWGGWWTGGWVDRDGVGGSTQDEMPTPWMVDGGRTKTAKPNLAIPNAGSENFSKSKKA